MFHMKRCSWVPKNNTLYCDYHDNEWGKLVKDDNKLFELLCLESYQSGLSWWTVLKKREAFKSVFYHYQIDQVALFTDEEMTNALKNPDIIRHRLKLETTVNNANMILKIQSEFGSFFDYIWHFVGKKVIVHSVNDSQQVLSQNLLSQSLSKDLKKKRF
ncbi:DNA-3-methyladenine glycosylase I [Streptococcus urinalis FB127-CNA-2]|uniref:Methyladenine glycosylase n=1 Tax=Streptococcus urinalis 2285-97 TaxID=764291 RepID=G5KGR3_9STRE|nr:methyladenine glycosylase [Streptococcus urinalis 2285-97]EKS20976.1 DNA-3-methyladenine glycosylase I [Streptococcus urinalis FB127-CNA-2]VEF30985.1 DNA-3-methyladenine glycosylase [Streptococcus urinalis]